MVACSVWSGLWLWDGCGMDAGVGQLLMTATASRPLAESEAHSATSEPTPAMPGCDAKPPAPQLMDEAGGALEVKPSPAVSALD